MWYDEFLIDSEVGHLQRKLPKLKKNVVPSIFERCLAHVMKVRKTAVTFTNAHPKRTIICEEIGGSDEAGRASLLYRYKAYQNRYVFLCSFKLFCIACIGMKSNTVLLCADRI